jgi:hypothetical protein
VGGAVSEIRFGDGACVCFTGRVDCVYCDEWQQVADHALWQWDTYVWAFGGDE